MPPEHLPDPDHRQGVTLAVFVELLLELCLALPVGFPGNGFLIGSLRHVAVPDTVEGVVGKLNGLPRYRSADAAVETKLSHLVYRGLEPNRLYRGEASAGDERGRQTRVDLLFDTHPAWRHRTMNEAETVLVQLHHPMDFHLTVEGEMPAEPFQTEVLLIASGPRNARLTVPGFYKGQNAWCVRFSPTVEGEWRLRTDCIV